MSKFFNKVKIFIKSFFSKYLFDKKTRSLVTTFIELPILIIGFILHNYSLIIWTCIGLGIFNAIMNYVAKKIIASKFKNSVGNINKNK